MGSDFEETFAKLARKQKKERATTQRASGRTPYLGDTETGRQIATGKVREDPEEKEIPKAQTWNIREIPAYRGHASKGRGGQGGIRRIGNQWWKGPTHSKT